MSQMARDDSTTRSRKAAEVLRARAALGIPLFQDIPPFHYQRSRSMFSKSPSVIVMSFVVVFAATPLRAQHTQGHEPQSRSGGRSALGPAATPGSLLRASDETLRALHAAVASGDRQLSERRVGAYVEAVDSLGAWSDGVDLTLVERDLSKAVAAIERHTKRLSELSAQAPPEFREVLEPALDASRRAGDSARAARETARSEGTSAGRHKNMGRADCGRH